MVQHPQSCELVAFRMSLLDRFAHSFLRISHSLWYVLVKELKLLMTNYFEDFVPLSKDSERARSDFVCPNVLQASWLGICRDG